MEIANDRLNKSLETGECYGPSSSRKPHPVETIQLSAFRKELKQKEMLQNATMGPHFSMLKTMERRLLAEGTGRLPGLTSNHTLLRHHLDLDEQIGLTDHLNLPENSPVPQVGFNQVPHMELEKRTE